MRILNTYRNLNTLNFQQNIQGTGIVYVGMSTIFGGGMKFAGDNFPTLTCVECGRRYAATLLLQDTPSAISLIAALWYHKFSFLLHFCYAWYRCYTLRSTSSKIVSVMVSLNSHCCYTFYIMVSLLLTAFKYLKNCHHYGLTKFTFYFHWLHYGLTVQN